MEYVLMDIKNFLQKLENGQLEIEAGQWELHKALSNMTKGVSELRVLREDVEDLKLNNIQQMGLIKQLQLQLSRLNGFQKVDPLTISGSSVEFTRIFKRSKEAPLSQKSIKKRKYLRSEESIEITSEISNEKSEPKEEHVARASKHSSSENQTSDYYRDDSTDEEPSQNIVKNGPYDGSGQHAATYAGANNDILERYLKDSIKYIETKVSNSAELNRHSSNRSEGENTRNTDQTTPFWDHYSSRAPPSRHTAKRNVSREPSQEVENNVTRKNVCPILPRMSQKPEPSKHEHVVEIVSYCKSCGKAFSCKEQLKNHETIHKISRSFKGFKCSYCTKSYRSPEKLTAHLRKCRLIMKTDGKSTQS